MMLSVILLYMLMILLFVPSVIRHLIYELFFELESDLQDTVDWGKKWLVDFNAGKTQLVLFDRSSSFGSIDKKMDVFVLEEKLFFGMLGLTFSSKLDWSFLHYLYCLICLQENWGLNSLYEVSFSKDCSVFL